MNRLTSRLNRLTEWLSFERLLMFSQAFYGLFVLAFSSFTGYAPWQSLLVFAACLHVSAECLFAFLLFSGATMQWVGLRHECAGWRLRGACAGFAAFFIALVSQFAAIPTGTGVPAYGILAAAYLLLVLRQASRVEWVSIRF